MECVTTSKRNAGKCCKLQKGYQTLISEKCHQGYSLYSFGKVGVGGEFL